MVERKRLPMKGGNMVLRGGWIQLALFQFQNGVPFLLRIRHDGEPVAADASFASAYALLIR